MSPYSYDYCKILIRKVSSCTQQDRAASCRNWPFN